MQYCVWEFVSQLLQVWVLELLQYIPCTLLLHPCNISKAKSHFILFFDVTLLIYLTHLLGHCGYLKSRSYRPALQAVVIFMSYLPALQAVPHSCYQLKTYIPAQQNLRCRAKTGVLGGPLKTLRPDWLGRNKSSLLGSSTPVSQTQQLAAHPGIRVARMVPRPIAATPVCLLPLSLLHV